MLRFANYNIAIKYYRENTGAGLAEAETAVEAIQQAFSEMLSEDPDEGLSVREDVEEALRRSVKAIREGGQT